MADGLFYNDIRAPMLIADPSIAPVSLATTDKALYTPSNFPVLGGQYWVAGKKMKIYMFGRMTTAANAGQLDLGCLLRERHRRKRHGYPIECCSCVGR